MLNRLVVSRVFACNNITTLTIGITRRVLFRNKQTEGKT